MTHIIAHDCILFVLDTTSEECNILNVVNWVYSKGCENFSWSRFGDFRFQNQLSVIEKSYPKEEYYVRAIELWYQRATEDERTWEQLEKRLKPLRNFSHRRSIIVGELVCFCCTVAIIPCP